MNGIQGTSNARLGEKTFTASANSALQPPQQQYGINSAIQEIVDLSQRNAGLAGSLRNHLGIAQPEGEEGSADATIMGALAFAIRRLKSSNEDIDIAIDYIRS